MDWRREVRQKAKDQPSLSGDASKNTRKQNNFWGQRTFKLGWKPAEAEADKTSEILSVIMRLLWWHAVQRLRGVEEVVEDKP